MKAKPIKGGQKKLGTIQDPVTNLNFPGPPKYLKKDLQILRWGGSEGLHELLHLNGELCYYNNSLS